MAPVMLFALIGAVRAFSGPHRHTALSVVVVVMTVAMLLIYTFFTGHRNYGGVAAAPRYYIWLTPLWLTVLPAGASLGARWWWWRGLAGVLLAVSVFSTVFISRDPWRFPWTDEAWRRLSSLNY
jgi:hypothetical protein